MKLLSKLLLFRQCRAGPGTSILVLRIFLLPCSSDNISDKLPINSWPNLVFFISLFSERDLLFPLGMDQVQTDSNTMSTETKPFEFQNWPVYREAVDFGISAHKLCGEFPRDGAKSISDQLRRASQSVSFNIAEGSSRFGAKEKVNFLRIARGSVFECVAILELVRGIEWIEEPRFDEFVQKLSLMGRMLSGFINHIEGRSKK